MRRLLLVVLAASVVAALSVGGATAKNGRGVSCVLHSKLTAKSESATTGSTSLAKGHTLIKVRADGTIEFKTQILNKANETFVAGHIHLASPAQWSCRSSWRPRQRRARAISSRAASQRRTRVRQGPPFAPTRPPTTSTTTRPPFWAARSEASCTRPESGGVGRCSPLRSSRRTGSILGAPPSKPSAPNASLSLDAKASYASRLSHTETVKKSSSSPTPAWNRRPEGPAWVTCPVPTPRASSTTRGCCGDAPLAAE